MTKALKIYLLYLSMLFIAALFIRFTKKPQFITHIITAAGDGDGSGHVFKNSWSGYTPGDTIYLRGAFKACVFENLTWDGVHKYVITNYPGEETVTGDSTWAGGSWATGFELSNCHGITIYGSNKTMFQEIGSKDANPNNRTAFTNIAIDQLSSDFIVHDITIREGGVGLFCKTEVDASNANTWYPYGSMANFEFYNIEIYNTYNEGMYIGHTGTWWDITTNLPNGQPYYPTSQLDSTALKDTARYKRPIKLLNVHIHDNYLHQIGNDGIQTSAIDSLHVHNNEVYQWCTKHGVNDNGGILLGGRVIGFRVHDNYVHNGGGGGGFTNGYGEPIQCFVGGGGATVVDSIYNNLLVLTDSADIISIRPQTGLVYCENAANPRIIFQNNTIAAFLTTTGDNCMRFNGFFGGGSPTAYSTKDILIGSYFSYYYTENGGSYTATNDHTFTTYAASGLDSANHWQGALTAAGYGYIYTTPDNQQTGKFRKGGHLKVTN